MSEAALQRQLTETLAEQGLEAGPIDVLAAHLLWRMGRSGDDGPVTVRVGYFASAALFADLPRLKSVTDTELEEAAAKGELRVEWVGTRTRP